MEGIFKFPGRPLCQHPQNNDHSDANKNIFIHSHIQNSVNICFVRIKAILDFYPIFQKTQNFIQTSHS